MSLSLAILVILVADAALIGLLAFVMSRANRLTPHASATEATARRLPIEALRTHTARAPRHTGRIAAVQSS
jgi:hypothetical protein